jgi:hypothetical protein
MYSLKIVQISCFNIFFYFQPVSIKKVKEEELAEKMFIEFFLNFRLWRNESEAARYITNKAVIKKKYFLILLAAI